MVVEYSDSIKICSYEIVKWLEQRIRQHKSISVNEVALKSGYSKWYFQRAFKAVHQITIADYIRQIRLAVAQEKLMNNESLAAISGQLGFESQSAFNRFFKRYIGISPGKYRMLNLPRAPAGDYRSALTSATGGSVGSVPDAGR